jgi:hypothetical protein
MPKLGSIDMKDVPVDAVDEMSSGDEQETQQAIETPSAQVSEPVPLPPKPKRKMSEKQLEALKRGRAKKLEMNLKSRCDKKKVPEEEKKEEVEVQQPSTPAPAAEKKRKAKKQKLPSPPSTPQLSEDSEESEEEESPVERTVGKYLKRYMDKSMRRETQRLDRVPPTPRLTRSGYDDIVFV